MADGLTLNAGAGGATLATDDAGAAGHIQLVKLAIATDGSAVVIPAEETNGLDVDVTRVIPGTGATHLGKAIDSAAGATDTGVALLGVRDDALSSLTPVEGDYVPVRVDSTGGLWVSIQSLDQLIGRVKITDGTDVALVDGSGNLQVVGTLAVTQSGTWDEVGINDSGNSLTVDAPVGTPVFVRLSDGTDPIATLPVSLAAVPSHAVTNAGTFAVQESGAALTALQLIDDPVAVLGTTTYTEATTAGMIAGAVRRDADTSLVNTTNEIAPLQVDARGALKVEAFSGETLPVSLASVPSHAVTNAGTFAVQVDGNALTALQKIDDPVLVDDAAFTPATSSVMMAGYEADEASTDSVDEGDAGAARMTLDRKQIVTLQPHTAGGCSPFYNLDVDETEDAIKATAGQLYELYLFNTTNAALYVKLYDATVAGTTVGTTTPVMTIPVPGNNDTDGAGVVRNWPNGLVFANAITIAATTAAADSDTGAPATGAIIASGAFK